jgi:exonuclease V
MKQGSKVHKKLEAEIHIEVPVEITKKEDSWGLRIWNIIQGLRTLKDTGRTRELEIWGAIGGETVNGIIDELSIECPDPKLEALVNTHEGKKTVQPEMNGHQTSIADFLQRTSQTFGHSIEDAMATSQPATAPNSNPDDRRIYITDIKTRNSRSLPTGSSLKPTILQLHLYHHMLENLVQGNFPLTQLATRYNLDTTSPFSDAFIAQIGNLNNDIFQALWSQDQNSVPSTQLLSSQDSMSILLQHNNLSSLWELMLSHFRDVFLLPPPPSPPPITIPPSQISTSDLPPPATQPTRLSPILTATYLSSSYASSSDELGHKSFVFNAEFLKAYLSDNLSWWRGEREARGVQLAEAWKCRGCDYRDDCVWIHERDLAAVREVERRRGVADAMEEGLEGVSRSRV